ncbi:asparaginase [Vampirovibrio chlorellavorus]|uniref:asparaginase n=1 Tax=Vampirovibrio chlorellavorus TaxID=758823 RepID=UPI0026F18A55|nr:asparaginase [Vampirovibrio chlorellavorus]
MTPPSIEPSVLVTANRYLTNTSDGELSNRESLIENIHLGWLVVSHYQRGLLYSTPGALETATFFRSSAKPFQAYPLVADELHHQLTEAELALTCASHVGGSQHLDLARSILRKAGLDENCLRCGPHNPIDATMRQDLRLSGQTPTAIHNNCSGKHAGMLFYCQQKDLPVDSYLHVDHPLQQRIFSYLRQWGRVEVIPTAIDGCGAPVFYLPLQTMALLYAHLGSAEPFAPLRDAMIRYPEIVGGEGRVDTVIMQASRGRLLAKVGADGVLCVSQIDAGEGLAVKIADGNEAVRNMAVVEILTRLGWLDARAVQDERLAPFQERQRFNTAGKAVGHYQVLYPPLPRP